jgi:alpha-tubulin suppressor-like RCC1 family protein
MGCGAVNKNNDDRFGREALATFNYISVKGLNPNERIIEITAYHEHVFLLTEQGRLFGYGTNQYGELGLGDKLPRNHFVFICEGVSKVAAGFHATIILRTDGQLLGCGYNSHGALGLDHKENRDRFERIRRDQLPEGDHVEQITLGHSHALILTKQGSLLACGANHAGQLGLGDYFSRTKFTLVRLPDDERIIQVSAGNSHTLILSKNQNLLGCGSNGYNQLKLTLPFPLEVNNTFEQLRPLFFSPSETSSS